MISDEARAGKLDATWWRLGGEEKSLFLSIQKHKSREIEQQRIFPITKLVTLLHTNDIPFTVCAPPHHVVNLLN